MDAQVFTEHFDLEDTHWWFRSKRTLILSLLRRYGVLAGPGLDVGCGAGGTLAVLAARGSWVGVDADPAALGLSRRRGLAGLTGGSAEALPFRTGTFAACLCLDLLYHRNIASESGALRECHRVLRPGGLLLVTDSAFKWLRSAHDEAVHGARRYTRREMVEHVRAAGFTPVLATYAYCLVFPAVAAVRLARRGASGGSDVFPVPRPINAALLGVQAVERALLRLGSLPFGSSVVLAARKATG
ncbi:MAG TPA: class I SAM-dependent methyltransferase [Methylomirabilota bacterium]|jgi:SAM-dependent methyltransferase